MILSMHSNDCLDSSYEEMFVSRKRRPRRSASPVVVVQLVVVGLSILSTVSVMRRFALPSREATMASDSTTTSTLLSTQNDLVPLLQLPILWLWSQDLFLSFQLFLTIHVSLSLVFSKLTFLGHRTGYEWTAGNEEIRDFG